MEFNLTTFFLELLNFIALVWLLKRLLFKPVKELIHKRQQDIQSQIDKAQKSQIEADQLKTQLNEKIKNWNEERKEFQHKLELELEAKRTKALDSLKEDLDNERIKSRSIIEKESQEAKESIKSESLQLAAGFASKFLIRLSEPGLDYSIALMALDDLSILNQHEIERIKTSMNSRTIKITSSQKLSREAHSTIIDKCKSILGENVNSEFGEDKNLQLGVYFEIGSFGIKANARDELESFFNHGN